MSEYDSDDFQADVIERSHEVPVVVDFWAEWCGPCKALGPVLEKLAGEAGGRWRLAKVDTDKHREAAAGYGIRSIPNVKLFVDGQPVSEFVGALPEQAVREWLAEALPGPGADRVRHARELMEGADPADLDEARQILAEVLEAEPGNIEAKLLAAEAAVFTDPSAASELLEGIDPGSPHRERAAAIGEIARLLGRRESPEDLGDSPLRRAYLDAIEALARRDWEASLAGFIEVVAGDRSLDDDGARRACIAIFTLLGDDAEITRQYRRAFSSAVLS
jgi:putative thioredoxin